MQTEISSLSEYLEAIKDAYKILYPYSNTKTERLVNNGMFFRGHSKSIDYRLLPSVLRNDKSKKAEKTLLFNFRDFMPHNNLSYDFLNQRIEILAMMQHYEIPTRLMDWTFSPLIALYFAVKEYREQEGAVWIFNPWNYVLNTTCLKPNDEYPDKHSAHIFARALLSDREKNPQNILKITNEKFGIAFDEKDLSLPFPFVSSFNNPRILHQRGCFTIHGTDNNDFDIQLDTSKDEFLIKLLIKNKETIYSELRMLFINEYSVYPDYEGMSKLMKEDLSLYKTHFNF